jgi:hypothetical protein
MTDLAGNTRSTLRLKEIMSNQEKLKDFEMKLIKNQQHLILNNGNKTSDYLFALSKLLKNKEKSYYMYPHINYSEKERPFSMNCQRRKQQLWNHSPKTMHKLSITISLMNI